MTCYDDFINCTFGKCTLGLGSRALTEEMGTTINWLSINNVKRIKSFSADLLGAQVSKQIALMWPGLKKEERNEQNVAGTNEPRVCSV